MPPMILRDCLDVPEMFARSAAERPNALAVVSGEGRLTFGELDRQTSGLAERLRALGVGPDVVVAVCAPRSIEFIVGALATLKAGGAYLPLDPVHPRARLEFMYLDARAAVLLATAETAALMPAHATRTVRLGLGTNAESSQAFRCSSGAALGDALAYVVYTSGSTGRPKGVGVPRSALRNLVTWHQRRFEVTLADRATLIANPGFDAATWEVWPYLTAGASIHIPNERIRGVPGHLRDWLLEEGITISFLPTPLAEAVLRLEWPARTALRTLLTGGDVLHTRPSSALPFVLVNNYGPTEAGVVATSGTVEPPEATGSNAPPIGRAIANVDVHIVRNDMTLPDAGTPGELTIGGAGLARGYLHRAALTAERFVPDPFSGRLGARLYRTGDLARPQPLDGSIEFLGRIDQQVKIRGLRIELGEIETVLARHPDVASAVVQAVLVPTGDMLVAYVVLDGAATVEDASLRAFLAVELPEYMIPSAFVRLERFSLTANGKVDRAALPAFSAPDSADAMDGTEPADARALSAIEERLARIVADVLRVERVGVDANLFSLGGHSLTAAQIIARVQSDFGVELTLRALFDAPTLTRLARTIEDRLLSRVEAMSDDDVRRMLDADLPVPVQPS